MEKSGQGKKWKYKKKTKIGKMLCVMLCYVMFLV